MNNSDCNQGDFAVHPSLKTLVTHARRIIEETLQVSSKMPISVMVQAPKKIVQFDRVSTPESWTRDCQVIEQFTELAKTTAAAFEVLALATIYRTWVVMGPAPGRTVEQRLFGSRPEKEAVLLNAESREGECSLTLEVLRDASQAFIGLREIQVPPLRGANGALVSFETNRFSDSESRQSSRFGLVGTKAPTPEERAEGQRLLSKPVRKKRSKAGALQDFVERVFPIMPPST